MDAHAATNRKRGAAEFLALACLIAAEPAEAVNRVWNAGTSGWNTGTNWTPAGTPSNADRVFINNAGTAQVTATSAAQNLTLGNTAGSSGATSINGGQLTINTSGGGIVYVGNGGTGTVNLSNSGVLNARNLTVGVLASATGNVSVSGAGSTINVIDSLVVGSYGTGNLSLSNGAHLSTTSKTFWVGRLNGSNGLLTLDGVGTRFEAETLSSSIGHNGGDGELRITNGAVLDQTGNMAVGSKDKVSTVAGTGVVSVDGAGSSMTLGGYLSAGSEGVGTVTVTNGAEGSSRAILLGRSATGTGTLTIDGAGSSYTSHVNPDFSDAIGLDGTGTVNVLNGASLTANNRKLYLGSGETGNGRLNIDGAGSQLSGSSDIVIGRQGTGRVDITDGGSFTTTGSLTLAESESSTGTLNIGNGGTVGTVSAASVFGGDGKGAINFNHSNAGLIFAAPMSGKLTVNQKGTGTTILTGNSDYEGTTTISDGVLQLGNGGTSGGITGDIVNNAQLAIDRSNTYLYSGKISGSGDVSKDGAGTTIFTGDHTYSGLTNINTGTLQLGNGGDTGSVKGNILNNAHLVIDRSNAYEYSSVISGTGDLTFRGGGSLALGRQQTYTGATTIEQGVLRAGVADVISSSSGLALRSGTVFHQGGYSQTVNNMDNAGLVDMRGNAAGNRLTVLNSYVGRNGVVAMNTNLSPSGAPTDQVVIDGGTATGMTALRIHNLSDGGARTTGDGIMVVNAANGGTTSTNAFSLGHRVVGGPYEYGLFRGGASAGSSDSWFLKTTGVRGETSLYPVLPAMGVLYGGKLLDTLDQRWGAWVPDEELAPIRVASNTTSGLINNYKADEIRRLPEGTWGRIIYQHGKRDGMAHGVSGVGASFEHDFYAMQGGIDLYRDTVLDGHRVYGGIYGAIGRGDGDAKHFDGRHAGSNSFDAYTIGGYWTHFGPQNWYVDTILQATWYDAKGQGNKATQALETDGIGYSASLEGGYPFKLDRGWLLEPQAQLIWTRLNMDDASDAGGTVNFDTAKSLTGRLGARLARSWNVGRDEKPMMRSIWGRLSTWREWNGDMRVHFQSDTGPVTYRSDISGSWWEINGGVTAQVNQSSYVTATVSYYKSYDGNFYAADARLGLKIEW
jgi:outer membrane autotransporter protein